MEAASPPHTGKDNYVCERHGQKVEYSLSLFPFALAGDSMLLSVLLVCVY